MDGTIAYQKILGQYKLLYNTCLTKLKKFWSPFPSIYIYFNFILENYDELKTYFETDSRLKKHLHIILSESVAYAGKSIFFDYTRHVELVERYVKFIEQRQLFKE